MEEVFIERARAEDGGEEEEEEEVLFGESERVRICNVNLNHKIKEIHMQSFFFFF